MAANNTHIGVHREKEEHQTLRKETHKAHNNTNKRGTPTHTPLGAAFKSEQLHERS